MTSLVASCSGLNSDTVASTNIINAKAARPYTRRTRPLDFTVLHCMTISGSIVL